MEPHSSKLGKWERVRERLPDWRNWVFAANSNFRIQIPLQPDGVNLQYFKLRLFNQTVWNIWGR